MKTYLRRIIRDVSLAEQLPNAYGYLSDIAGGLRAIDEALSTRRPNYAFVVGQAGAVGRLVTEDFGFSESALGLELLGLVNRIVNEYGALDGTKDLNVIPPPRLPTARLG